ncbi:hypothetical protein [Cellulomonas fimi]|uniref:hypothetical protein n=1 Tax=Cellulomonas fimi TaxID=1708 RepID=UPI000F81C54F|nr:hypothetical protein [Cellulomonas fimi]NNH07031.1 hypothetical protein [Cellulomonas fimi]
MPLELRMRRDPGRGSDEVELLGQVALRHDRQGVERRSLEAPVNACVVRGVADGVPTKLHEALRAVAAQPLFAPRVVPGELGASSERLDQEECVHRAPRVWLVNEGRRLAVVSTFVPGRDPRERLDRNFVATSDGGEQSDVD